MNREISRKSYVDFMNRMQVVINTDDNRTHVLNFINYSDPAHSHIVYYNGQKEYRGAYDSRDCYGHNYTGNMVDYYNAEKTSSFPYTFEQIHNEVLAQLDAEQLVALKEYLLSLENEQSSTKSR